MTKTCRDCLHWEHEWYSEEWDEFCGYGCHLEDGEVVNVGICLLRPEGDQVRLENTGACKDFQRKDAVDEDVENLLFGE
jgi:hypothetical protein